MRENFLFLPYKCLKFYVLTILILSLFGPINYGYDFIYGVFTFIYIILFLRITKFGMQLSKKYKPKKYTSLKSDKFLKRILKISLIIVLVIKIMLLLSSIKIYGLPKIDENFFNMLAKVYTNLHHAEYKENFYRQIDTFFTFLFYFSFFIGVFWFKRISNKFRLLLLINISLDFVYQIFFIGTQRSIITFVILFLVLIVVSSINSRLNVNKKKLLKIFFLIFIAGIILLNGLSARRGMWNPLYYRDTSNEFNLNSLWLFIFKSPRLKYDICNMISYFTQGFYGLSLSFQTKFEWTFFLGGFRGINNIVSQINPLIPDMARYSYPIRTGILFDRDGYVYWYSIFPWLASDFTFLGALIYMGVVAKLYMKCWIQTVKYKNPLAFIILVLLSIQYIFVVANNQLFVTRGESLATIILLIIYLLWNKKFNYPEFNR